jgi:carbon starvation protein
MSLLIIALVTIATLVAGYILYGSLVARIYSLSDLTPTPATQRRDGIDFVPTRPFYLLGQHFSAIAAAGPIVGPIAACMMFGWGPCLLWILIGVVFIGAVHDFSALVASIRHGAHSVAAIAREHLGKRAWLALICFIWLALVYVIVAFTDVTARTFQGLSEELLAAPGSFNKGGAVAASSVMYMGVAIAMGLCTRFLRMPTWLATATFLPATLGCVWLGAHVDHLINMPTQAWYVIILAYCFVASLLPVWLLQQPRGYLGGFVLYLAIGVGLAGVLFGGFEVRQPAFKGTGDYGAFFGALFGTGGDQPPMTSLIFPFLFVTIACGACSGFHGLICGGTTSKQIEKESHCQPVAFGAMLLEGLVAVVALATVMIVASDEIKWRTPGVLYGDGLATFITRFLDPAALRSGDAAGSTVFLFAATFGAMAFSTFVFDTLDVSTRLGRYLLCELVGTRSQAWGVVAAALTAGVPLAVLLVPTTTGPSGAGGPPAFMLFWTLFGTANQLLACLTLLGVTVWLHKSGRTIWFTLIPMVLLFAVTLTALSIQIFAGARTVLRDGSVLAPAALNGVVAVALLGLAGVFAMEAVRAMRKRPVADAQ